MFVLVMGMEQVGLTARLSELMLGAGEIWRTGIGSFLAANLVNNIPMSVLFASILANAPSNIQAIYATVVGSNLGACFTPIGALAGIMWCSILREYKLKFRYVDFLRIGVTVAIPALIVALLVISLIV
jgi:arsenical pump membrane protein